MIYKRKEIKTRAERDTETVKSLEAFDDFVEMAEKIANLMKDLGSVPTPRQLKLHLDIDAKNMKAVCKGFKIDPYEALIREARQILLKKHGISIVPGGLQKVLADF